MNINIILMKTIDFSYFIERFIADEMNEAEKQWFLKELDGNQGLREEVALRERTDKVLKSHDVIRLRNKLSEIENSRSMPIPTKTTGKRLPISIAAALAGLIIISSITFFGTKHLTNDEILNQYYKSYDGGSISRSSQAATNSDYSTGMEYYNIHDYKNAALYFSKVLYVDPENNKYEQYSGNEFAMIIVRDKPDFFVWRGKPKDPLIMKQINTNVGYTVELRLPWKAIGKYNKNGYMGLEIQITDADVKGSQGIKLSWNCDRDNAYYTPHYFGVVKMGE